MNELNKLILTYSSNTLAINERGEQYSYKESIDLALTLKDKIEGKPLVFCLSENNIGSLLGYLSFLQNGWATVMLNADQDEKLLNGLIDTYSPNLLWLPDALVNDAWGARLCYKKYGYSLIQLSATELKLHSDLILLLTTSGSTGSPKLVRLSLKNILSNAFSIAEYLTVTCDDRPITSLPMYYSFGLSVINSHIIKGATILLTKRSVMEKEFWNMVKEYKATSLSGVPYTFEMLNRLRFQRMELPDLRYLTQAGGKLNNSLIENFANYANETGRRFFVMYGQTEATARISYLPSDKCLDKIGSIGVAIPKGRLKLLDDNNNEITEANISGELVYYGDNVSLGYAESVEDLDLDDENKGQLLTGDIANRDEEGYYYIVGRKKRFIKLFGNRVNLDAAELLLKSTFEEIACTGDDKKMVIYTTHVNQADEIRTFIAHKLKINASAFAVRHISEIPKSSSGKVLYSQLSIE